MDEDHASEAQIETHSEPDTHAGHDHIPQESPWVVTLPLILLAIPSVAIGWFTIGPLLFGDYWGGAIVVAPARAADPTPAGAPRLWAVVVGIDRYDDRDINPCRGAEGDER